jgi:hypothetical protein
MKEWPSFARKTKVNLYPVERLSANRHMAVDLLTLDCSWADNLMESVLLPPFRGCGHHCTIRPLALLARADWGLGYGSSRSLAWFRFQAPVAGFRFLCIIASNHLQQLLHTQDRLKKTVTRLVALPCSGRKRRS